MLHINYILIDKIHGSAVRTNSLALNAAHLERSRYVFRQRSHYFDQGYNLMYITAESV